MGYLCIYTAWSNTNSESGGQSVISTMSNVALILLYCMYSKQTCDTNYSYTMLIPLICPYTVVYMNRSNKLYDTDSDCGSG